MRTIFLLLGLSTLSVLHAQYNPDRHNTSYNAGWVTCEAQTSPNPARGNSYWIMYDFSQVYPLSNSTIWNYNAAGLTDVGIKDMVIDYSIDGVTWTEYGQFTVEQANASGYYTGSAGPDLTGIEARFILITARSNHGGDCVGFSEIRFDVENISSDVKDLEILPVELIAIPNPFMDQVIMGIGAIEAGAYQWQLTDLSGRVLRSERIDLSSEGGEINLETHDLPQGMYVFSLRNAYRMKSIRIEKIVKQ